MARQRWHNEDGEDGIPKSVDNGGMTMAGIGYYAL